MIGAIIGDIVGSRFEFNNHRSTEFELFHKDCSFTDDTICTVAVAEWMLRKDDPMYIKFIDQQNKAMQMQLLTKIMRKWCRLYPNPAGGYGGRFNGWIWEETIGGYDSFGNGSAMRVSPVAWAFNNRQDVIKSAKLSAEISHDHPEGIKGAESVASLIYFLRRGMDKARAIDLVVTSYGYKFPGSCEFIRDTNTFNETCQVTVPQAFQCFAESTDFESAIRLAVSIGGDSDTIAAIVGSLAEACYGVPGDILLEASTFLPGEMVEVINRFQSTFSYNLKVRK